MMRVTIFGAGAIGGYLAARLAAAGAADLSVVARGAHGDALRERGLRLVDATGDALHRLRATDDPAALGPQDYVILALKAHAVPAALPAIAPLLAPDTAVVTLQNGIPWWYFHRSGGPHDGSRIAAVDPGGAIAAAIGPGRAIGAAVYVAAEIVAPGVVRHGYGERIVLGEPSGETTPRVVRLAGAMAAAGIAVPVTGDIRGEIWLKLWGNVAFNPVSALTRATLGEIAGDAGARDVVRAIMREAEAVAAALGIRFPIDVETRIARAGAVGAHRSSMLQDLERGRPLEIDPLVAAVQELGRLTGRPTPAIDMVLALVRRLDRSGCQPSPDPSGTGPGTRP